MCYSKAQSQDFSQPIAPSGANQQVLGPNPHRIAIILTSHKTVDLYYHWQIMTAIGQGMLMLAGQRPLVLTGLELGEMLHSPMYAFASAANAATFTPIEVYKMPKDNT